MAVNVFGILGIALFYVVILVIGLLAARFRGKSLQRNEEDESAPSNDGEEVMLAGRNIGMFVGAFTMTGIKCSCDSLHFNMFMKPFNCSIGKLWRK